MRAPKMNRRRFLASTAAASIGLGLESKRAWSQLGMTPPIVSVNPQAILNALQRQECNSWCWAACLSTIFNFYGHPLDQKEIVAARFGGQVVCQGDPTVIAVVTGLNRTWTDDNGVSFTSHINAAYDHNRGINTLTNRMIINELANGRPLYFATRQHAMILFRAQYVNNPGLPDAQILGVRVADPFPDFDTTHLLPLGDMTPVEAGGNMIFCASVSIS
jgi:Papain-like cysteine protease AvrRpt2